MSDFAQKFVFVSIVVGVLVSVFGVVIGSVSLGFFLASMLCFCVAFWVLWDHAR